MSTVEKEKMPYPLSYFDHNGKEWEYIVSGKGSAFVIFPGGGETAESNFRFIRAMEGSYKVIVPTIYDVDSLSEFNSAINKLLDIEKAGTVILYGLSMGGCLAQTYTRDNPDRVNTLILSHTCTPNSKTYERKVITPLRVAKIVFPIVPDGFIRFASRFAGSAQGVNKEIESKYPVNLSATDKEYYAAIMDNYFDSFANKRLIQSWINIHLEFFKQNLEPEDFAFLKDRILILRTDNDPLMQDEGNFKRVYPDAEVQTFKDTGHGTAYFQLDGMIETVKEFLNKEL